MISLTCFKNRFTPDWRMTLLTCVALAFFCHLGFWQLERAQEKIEMLSAQASQAKQASKRWQSEDPLPKQYQSIRVSGDYLDQHLLFDNQHYQHQLGYHVLTPFQMANGSLILIDRGWVSADQRRQVLPKISTPMNSTLDGTVYYPSEKNWVLGPNLEKKGAKLTIVERIDTKLVGQFLHKSVYPFIIRLNKESGQEYVREWPVVAMSPDRHYGYAFQWFAIASVILILFVALNLKKKI
ncbi:MAG: SURF1 family protein [Tatlockia sp.]|nr:SURF1 family protein [Tatlockia sp.]